MEEDAVVTYGRRKRRSPSNEAEEAEEEEKKKLQRRKSPALTQLFPRTEKYKQYFLDFGQLDFSYSTCKICGLLYARGHSEDEKLHALFHKRYINGLHFKGWQKERLVVKHERDDERIILVMHSDPLQHQLKVKELVKIMEKDLGIEPGWLLHDRCKVYLYISLKKIVGCAVTEPITEAYPVVWQKEPMATSMELNDSQSNTNRRDLQPCSVINSSCSARDCCREDDMSGSSKSCLTCSYVASQSQQKDEVERASNHGAKIMVFGGVKFQRERVQRCNAVTNSELPAVCTKHPVSAVCGIRGLWVSKSERRRGVATHLMDAVRTSFMYGLILDVSQCAFSQPTPEGKAFAAMYSKTGSYLVYS